MKLYKRLILQFYGYTALLPFYFAFKALKENHSRLDIAIFIIALIFILVVLVINHLDAVITIKSDKIIINNKFNNRPDTQCLKDLLNYKIINNKRVILIFKTEEYDIKLNRSDMKKLISFLKENI